VFNRLHIPFAADASYNERVSEWFGEMSMLALCGCIPVTKMFKSVGRLSQNFDNNYDIGCCSDIIKFYVISLNSLSMKYALGFVIGPKLTALKM